MYEDIKRQFIDVIAYSQQIHKDNLCVDDLFAQWEKNKTSFINRFKGLIYEAGEVDIQLDENQKQIKVLDFCDGFCEHMNVPYSLISFIKELSLDEFYSNYTQKPHTIIFGGNTYDIPKGMKVNKAFKLFSDDIDLIKIVQQEASKLTAERSIHGVLCFSVHPLDFLSISENISGWRSCHALDGDDWVGNLNYMADNTTFICYLRSKDNVQLPHFPDTVPWNNKKWRVLLHQSKDWSRIYANRQYPFFSKELMKATIPAMRILYSVWDSPGRSIFWEDLSMQPPKDIFNPDRYYPLTVKYLFNSWDGQVTPVTEMIKDGDNTFQYDDITHANGEYNPLVYINRRQMDSKELTDNPIIIGESVNCLICNNQEIALGDKPVCLDCAAQYGYSEDVTICDCCENTYLTSETYITIEGQTICYDCLSTYCVQCSECHEYTYLDNAHFNEETGETLCKDCYDNKGE